MTFPLRLYFACVILVCVPFVAGAHDMGASFEQEVGEYRVDIGYDPMQPQGGDRLLFDFAGLMKLSGETVDFDYVWVRVEYAGTTLLATGIARAEFGPTSLLLALPEDVQGEIVVHARYQESGDAIVVTSFPLIVDASSDSQRKELLPIIVGIVALVIGGIVGVVASRFIRAQRT